MKIIFFFVVSKEKYHESQNSERKNRMDNDQRTIIPLHFSKQKQHKKIKKTSEIVKRFFAEKIKRRGGTWNKETV